MAKKPKKGEDGAEADAGGEEGGGGGLLKNKKVLIGGVAVLVLALGGGGYMYMKKKGQAVDAAADAAKAAQKKTAFIDLKEMVISISGSPAEQRSGFIKMKVALELSDSRTVPEVQPLIPRVEDTFQVYMRELRPADLEGSAGMFRLKEELLRRVNVAVYPVKVDAVLFKELLVQ